VAGLRAASRGGGKDLKTAFDQLLTLIERPTFSGCPMFAPAYKGLKR
jgi:hypothetical protein